MHYTMQLTSALQVYGGSISFTVNPFVRSSSSYFGQSSSTAGDTIVSGLSAIFVDCNISDSKASTRTNSGSNFSILAAIFVTLRHFSQISSQIIDRRGGPRQAELRSGSVWC